MNLEKLFKMQKELDERILDRFPELRNEDLLDKKILALQVELGELAQNWRGFKFWSHDQEPRTWYPNEKDICESCKGQPIFIENGKIVGQCEDCDGCGVHFHNPLLEEYVDCLHFVLSIGLELGCTFNKIAKQKSRTVTLQFIDSFHATAILFESIESDWDEDEKLENFENVVAGFLGLGEMLGFTWQEIEQAYLDKNKINHKRQEEGY